MTKLLLANLASPANPGDQAILLGTLKLLKTYFRQPEITLVTRASSGKKIYEKMGCHVLPSYPNVEKMDSDSSIKRILAIPGSFTDPDSLKKAVRTSDAVFLAGGAYLYSYRPLIPGLTYASHFSAAYWARHFKKPLILLPQSFGPFHSWISRKFFDAAVAASDLVFYREEISGNFLKKKYPNSLKKINFLPDLALNLSTADLLGRPPRTNLKTGIVGVTVRQWCITGQENQAYIAQLADALAQFHRQFHTKIRIVVQVQARKKSEGDESVSRLLENLLVDRIGQGGVELRQKKPYFQLSELCEIYEECEMLVATRLHSGLLAFLLGRPALVIGYQHKAEGILRSLGLDSFYGGFMDQIKSSDLYSKIEHLWRERESASRRIEENLAKTRSNIEIMFKEKMEGLAK